jgi:hypothetical protein
MNTMAAMVLAVTGITVIIIMITAAFGGEDRGASSASTSPTAPVSAPTRMGPIRAQYLPALAQTRLLRLRMAQLSTSAAYRARHRIAD